MEPIRSRFDSSVNYIIEDSRTLDAEGVADAEDVSDVFIIHEVENTASTSMPAPSIPSAAKKRKIADVYDNINAYTSKKLNKNVDIHKKLKIELEILEIKNQKELELLAQEKFNTKTAEFNSKTAKLSYMIKKKELDKLDLS
ncbi:hypothetical protein FQR65_LT16001 [Abscondita terminalis]|nr:hypothetical protein FQR65_LT16001 [Abscondita terminalis]